MQDDIPVLKQDASAYEQSEYSLISPTNVNTISSLNKDNDEDYEIQAIV